MKIPKPLEFDAVLNMLAEKAMSEPGRLAAASLAPTADFNETIRLMNETEEAETLLHRLQNYPMRPFLSINAELKRLKTGGLLSPAELLAVAGVMKAARAASVLRREEDTPAISALAQDLNWDDRFISRVDESIISDAEIADSASSELSRIRRAIRNENDRIRDKLQNLIRSSTTSKYLQDAIITQRNGRYVVPVKSEHKGDVSGIVHERSASGATLFIEPASVVESNNKIRELEGLEAVEINRILTELTRLAANSRESLRDDLQALTELDVIFAKASLAKDMHASPVEFNTQNIIKITEGRHPLIPKDKVVPVSITLDSGIRGLIITGPNTGGKTVTLKLAGLFCAMAQTGLFLPAQGVTQLPVFDGIFADIGDEQSIQQSLSTFSAHMKSIIFAVKHAGERSIVLLDELGAGTDPQEGSALAQAVLKYLYEKGAVILTTTHIGELKAFAVKNEGFENASMEFDAATLTPTYRLIMGVAGKSNALTISKSLGLPAEIAAAAQGYMSAEAVEYDKLLERAQKDRKKAAEKLKQAKQELADAKLERERAVRVSQKAAERKKRILEQANEKAIEIIDDAREVTERAITEAKKIKDSPEGERTKKTQVVRDSLKAKRRVISAHDKIQKKKLAEPLLVEEIKEGDAVVITDMNMPATVLRAPDSKGMVRLQAGIMQTEVHFSDLTRGDENKTVRQKDYMSHVDIASRSNISMSLDLHGENVDNATILIDKYLDDAFLAGLKQVTIVHGRGTGVLRSGVQAYLKRHPHVKSIRQAAYDEGGAGATVVTLK